MTRKGQLILLVCLISISMAISFRSRPIMAAVYVIAAFLAVDRVLFLINLKGVASLSLSRRFGQSGEHGVVFSGHSISVDISLRNTTKLPVSFSCEDLVPHGITHASWEQDNSRFTGTVETQKEVHIRYQVRAPQMATIMFPGLSWTAYSPAGIWKRTGFSPLPGSLRSVPDIFSKYFLKAWHKKRNILLLHGRHQQLRGGMGAELLSLRDYQTGDPMKTIAWKASGRRDRLLTKTFENEVPVYIRFLFQPGLRFWSGTNPAVTESLTYLAKLAKVLSEHKDLVEFICPGTRQTVRTGAGRTRRHLGALLNAMGRINTGPAPVPGAIPPEEARRLLSLAFVFDPDLQQAAALLRGRRSRLRRFSRTKDAEQVLALFLSSRFDLGPAATCLLERNPAILGYFWRKFAHRNGLKATLSENAISTWALPECTVWAPRLNRALNTLIRKARDEELFIVMADFSILPGRYKSSFVEQLRTARAHGHRFVVYWPDLPAPTGPLHRLSLAAVNKTEAFQHTLRGLDIPAGPFDPAAGFAPILGQLKQLKKQPGVRSWN